MTKERKLELDDILLNYADVPAEVLRVVLAINGVNEETYSNILYYYTGYKDIKEFIELIERELCVEISLT